MALFPLKMSSIEGYLNGYDSLQFIIRDNIIVQVSKNQNRQF
jgi:hypothetical protein